MRNLKTAGARMRNLNSRYSDGAQLHLRMAFFDSRKCKLRKGVPEEYLRN
ncbi:MAG: hypothetical protein HDQ96_16015 [Lachnospiraceae bacterium]|nr:hypothetical protein [Lachnospiraceae bacterium]